MALTLKLKEQDAHLIQKVLRALVARGETCDEVLHRALVTRTATHEDVAALVRIASYIETVELAG